MSEYTDTVKQLAKPPSVVTRLRLAGHTTVGILRRSADIVITVLDTGITIALAGLFILMLFVAAAVWDRADMPWVYWPLFCASGLLSARPLGNMWADVMLDEAPLIAIPVTTLLFTLVALQGIASVACGGGWHAWFETTTGLIGFTATYVPTLVTLKIMLEEN